MADPALNQARERINRGDSAGATAILQRLLQRDPSHADALHMMASILARTGPLERALYCAQRAATAAPNAPHIHATLASILMSLNHRDQAFAALDHAAKLSTGSAPSLLAIVGRAWELGHLRLALDASEQAMRLDPVAGRGPHSSMLLHLGEVDRAVHLLRDQLSKDPSSRDVLLGLVQALNYWPDADPREVLDLHRRLGQTFASFTRPPRPLPTPFDPDRPLRVGFISPDFYTHSVPHFADPLIRYLDRSAFHIFCYSSCQHPDAVTTRLRSIATHWRDIARLTPAAVLAQLDQDRLDILIDLAGVTSGNVLHLLAARPAPIQVTAIGYPNTTGLPQVDFRIVDAVTDLPESLATETLERIPGCFLCFRPPDEAPVPAPRSPGSPLTFGSFNVVHKISPPVVQTWTRLLQRLPSSRLLLKSSQFISPDIRATFAARFVAAGLDPARLDLLPPIPSLAEHLALYSRIDIALDTFPYGGTTTTCEALYMGVPVVTLAGRIHASRVGASLLTTVNLPELIATTHDDYINTAAALAADAPRLASLRSTLRDRILSSPLCDGPAYGSKIGLVLRKMWRSFCSTHHTPP